ncbi:MAG: AAA family ATPase [Caenispirillum bisanense]|nr:AAA family ATPase [Caenispirillum bisanense]MCA1974517.1 AAA family ATPase [Caenispirillum sp.]
MLVVLSGLPGTGKTTIGKALAAKRSAVYVRVDEVEHVLTHHVGLGRDLGPAGYLVAFAIAGSNLKVGNLVIGDSVNPVPESRQGWHAVAEAAGCPVLDVEVVCSDKAEHRRRVETRAADIPGFDLPTWQQVQAREYIPWTAPRLVLDTARLGPGDAVAEIEARIQILTKTAAVSDANPSLQ